MRCPKKTDSYFILPLIKLRFTKDNKVDFPKNKTE